MFAVRVNDTNQIRISELKFLIWNEKKEIVNNIVDIEDKLGDVKLSLDRMLENYFSVIPITTSIHIIVLVPTAAESRFEPPKTQLNRFGRDLFDKSDDKSLKPFRVWNNIHFNYLYMDFGISHKLDYHDYNLDTMEIDSWDKLDISNNSSIIRPTIFVQPFFSGTAPKAILAHREPWYISFG
ncbi:hypothetical protein RhiirA1_451758 [Rhizophagus irregularis]|uniref:Uncharacterized protein n=1 Tax=Rhizophagus irregularis TaxID=588596 RepID=A0A2N0SBJ6_9GLOM|nr:hypothetical protein RhiirA1_451758 [Rhizophagus irregularis]